MTDRAMVMYGGRVVEEAPTEELFRRPRHPYTRVLIDSVPERSGKARLVVNEGVPPDHEGCVFARRCPFVQADCLSRHPLLSGDAQHAVSCFHPLAERRMFDRINQARG
jgi:oligopeptide/dipeptide ABC transporter ATP-binding protein